MPAMTTTKNYATIHEAVQKKDVTQLELMVKGGASINEVEEVNKFTPLHTACNAGALECLHWLLWHSADPTVSTGRGWTPAHICAIRGHDSCMQALVNNGVSMSSKDIRGSTPVHLAAAHGNSFALHTILRAGVDVNAVEKNGWTAVHCAAYHGRLGCLQMLVKWGGSSEDVDHSGNTPAHLAAMEGHLPCLKYLVSCGMNPLHILGARNDQGELPKDLAQQFYKDAVVEYINNIEWEKDHPEEVENLAFPAHVAAYNGDLQHMRLLIENGVININERDDKGSTPAHKAAGQGHLHILQWLIEMGANMSLQNQAGETPRDLARRFARLDCVKLLGGDAETDIGFDEDEDAQSDENIDIDATDLTDAQKRESRGRARKKVEELERLYNIAKQNYTQLGGRILEDRKRLQELRDKDKTIEELQAQLDYERLRREKLEAQLDGYRREIGELNYRLDNTMISGDSDEAEYIPKVMKTKRKTSTRKKRNDDSGNFIKRNIPFPSKGRKTGY